MNKLIHTIIFLLFCSTTALTQELICDVSVVAPDASKIKSDSKVFKTLENSVTEFLNNTKWTSENYSEFEKIECSIFIGIKTQSGDKYSGTITIISKRPVYNSSYNTTVLNIIDNDFSFNYKEFEPIEFAENQFVSNLSHVLSFYAYTIIGMDNETFTKRGGDVHLQKAADIVNIVSSSEAKNYVGWKSYDKNKRNRYWLITNLLNSRYDAFRDAQYIYYREGLDNFYTDPILARTKIKEALQKLALVSQDDPNISIMQMWSETKSQETINIYKKAEPNEKTAIVNILRKVDPVNADKYNVITK